MNRIEKRGKVSIIDGKYVLKEESDLKNLGNYLLSRDFPYFLNVVERNENTNKYDYIEDFSIDINQKGQDIANTLALLHNKTSFSKEVNLDKYKDIYDNLLGYINYVDEYYLKMLKTIEYIDFPSPSELLFITNYSKIKEALFFDKKELEKWFSLVKDNTKERVSLNHGDMRLEHVINNDKTYFISWGKNTIDSPVLDLINFYHNEWNRLEFSNILDRYFSKCELKEEEKKLFFINISIPLIIDFKDDEMDNVVIIRNIFDYLYKTEHLIGPYYTKQNEEQK